MRRTEIMRELVNRGYDVEETNVVKNGVTLKGIVFNNGSNVRPTLYVNEDDDRDLATIVDSMVETFERSKAPDFDTNELFSKQYIYDHLRVGFQRAEDIEDVVKKSSDLDGIEEYLYCCVDSAPGNVASFKVKKSLLDHVGMTEDDAFHRAYENMHQETEIRSMAEIMAEMMGFMIPELTESQGTQMYVLSNKSKYRGAATWVDKESIKAFAERNNATKLLVLPSSIHEMIIVPVTDGMENLDSFTAMAKEVNGTQVSPEEQLSDRAYFVEV